MQTKAGDAALRGGIAAVRQLSAEFAALVERDEAATPAAIARCPAFAETDAAWDRLNQDFQPTPASPATTTSSAIRKPSPPVPTSHLAEEAMTWESQWVDVT